MSRTEPVWSKPALSAAHGPMSGSVAADVVVIGAGLTGLSTANAIIDSNPDVSVVVLEAAGVGGGASGRGTGLLGPRIGPSLVKMRRRYGEQTARAAYWWSVDAVEHALGLIEDYGIECDLTAGDQYVVADDHLSSRRQQTEGMLAHSLGLPVQVVPRPELYGLAGRYWNALRYWPAATLDPAALTRGLASRLSDKGVSVYCETVATEIRHGRPISVVTNRGEVSTDALVIAVNAYIPLLDTKTGTVPLRVQACASEPLRGPALDAVVELRTRPIIGQATLSPYYRITGDNRLVCGGGAADTKVNLSTAIDTTVLRESIRRLDSRLSDVRIDSSWGGRIALTRDDLPVLGQFDTDRRIVYATGCCGHGLGWSMAAGRELAKYVLHEDARSLPFPWQRTRAPQVPSEKITSRLVGAYLARVSERTRASTFAKQTHAAR